ncbi:MAG: LON peptidase substrate-binding domain-containing protein [Acidobacteria bacterium]|nr:LON peptidase substrate-binding domain-containing protein [Acidobacteriota bacterium]
MAQPKTLTLPAIPIRDMVLFPGARVPFVVGRAASVKTLELAIKAGDHLLMLTQRDAKVESPALADLYAVGTLALVESVIALPRTSTRWGSRASPGWPWRATTTAARSSRPKPTCCRNQPSRRRPRWGPFTRPWRPSWAATRMRRGC